MSIYSIMAYNAATDKMKQNIEQSQNIQAKKVQNQSAQEELDLNKKLNQAKIKQARNEGMMSDYVGDALEKSINEQHKAKADQLEAIGGLQDIAEHKAQTGALQAGQFAAQLHQQDPDVQAHASTLSSIMQANSTPGQAKIGADGNVNAPSAMATVNPLTSAGPSAGTNAAIPSIFPMTANAPSAIQPTQTMNQPEVPPAAQAQPSQQMPQPTSEPSPDAPGSSPAQPSSGIDLSPIEKAMGYPNGSLWLDPKTMKPAINPIWQQKIEKEQAAQANYDVNQPFRETQRQDKLEQRATQLVTKAIQNRSGGVGLQDNKVNAAIHARELINQAYNPETGQYDVTQVPYGELAESLGSLLSGGTGSSEGRINSLKQRTAQGDINAALSYVSGKPSNATSQEALKQLVHMIDRQGQVSEDLRDGYLADIKKLPVFNELDPERAQALLDTNIGASFKEHLKNAPDKQSTAKDTSNSFASEAEAEKANLPSGTIITINGRKAKVN